MIKIPRKTGGRGRLIVVGSVLLLFVVARLLLPVFVTKYVNEVLAGIPGYRGSIEEVDIHLFRGAYTIDGLTLMKIDGNSDVPFISIPKTDLSVEWRALFNGAIVGKVAFLEPKINFIGGHEGSAENNNQFGTEADWTVPIKRLMPLKLNRLEMENGTITFHDFTTTPQVDLKLTDFYLLATNLNNASDQPGRLPSHVVASAQSTGEGALHINMNINAMKPIPDLDMDLRFEGVHMPALNDFFRAYTNADVENGVFNLYAEIAIDSANISGYIKPLARNVIVMNFADNSPKPLNLMWHTIVGFFAEVFENQREEQVATRVPLRGNLRNVEAGTWPTVWNIFGNAFVKAFERNIDNTVEFANIANTTPADDRKERRAQRKQKREERKQERKSKS